MEANQKAKYLIEILGSKTSAIRVCERLIESSLDKEYYKQVKEEIWKQ